MNNEEILGVKASTLSYEALVEEIDQKIIRNEKVKIVAVNPEKIMMAQNDQSLRELINSSTYQIPDGVGVVLISKLRQGSIKSRVTGIGLMEKMLELANRRKYKIFMYGASEETIKEAKKNIESSYPNLIVAGYLNGYIKDKEQIINEINNANPDILFVALGSPRQEIFIRDHFEQINAKVFQGVGGSFDVFSGNVKRAPVLFQKTGLEWFYRLMSQPSRIKRQLALPKFLYHALFKR